MSTVSEELVSRFMGSRSGACNCKMCVAAREKGPSQAEITAARLLLEHLDEEQREYACTHDHFIVQGRAGRYVLYLDGYVGGHCIAVAPHWDMPLLERVLMVKLWIETNEKVFRQVANKYTTTFHSRFGQYATHRPLPPAYVAPDLREK